MRPSQLRCQVTGEQVAPQREPYELRGSRPVLRGRGGEIPPRYSPRSYESSDGTADYTMFSPAPSR